MKMPTAQEDARRGNIGGLKNIPTGAGVGVGASQGKEGRGSAGTWEAEDIEAQQVCGGASHILMVYYPTED